MNCVQSNITLRIKRLEDHFGQPIFERGRGGARLTAFGHNAYGHAVDLIAQFEAAERDLLDAASDAAPLRLGAMETTAAARLPEILKRLRARCPDAPISLQTGPTAKLLALLWDRKIEAAFVAGPVDAERFVSVPAFREQLVLVEAAAKPSEGPLIAFHSGCSYRASAEAWLRAEGRMDTEIVEMGSFDGILGCVEAEMGFAVAPLRAIRARGGREALTVTPLPKRFAAVETRLAMRRDTRPVKAAKALKDILKQRAARDEDVN